MQRQLYQAVVPDGSQLSTSTQIRRQTQSQSPLGEGAATATPISLEPGEYALTGYYYGDGAGKMATEIEELFDASGFGVVPFYATEETSDADGYYTLRDVQTEPFRPQTEGNIHRFDGVLEPAGTRRTHLRSVDTSPAALSQTIATPTTEQPYVGVGARATLVRWYDATSGSLDPATPVDTVETEFGAVDRYDPTAAPTDAPELTFSLAYQAEGDRDVVAWSTEGHADKTDSDGVVHWRRLYATSSEPRGALVLSTRAIRVTIDEDAGTLTAEEWDASAAGGDGAWTDIALPASDWEPVDVDLVYLGPARIQAQLVFENSSTGELATVDGRWHRGWDRVQWSRAVDTEPTPSGLVDLLEPTASQSVESPGSEAGLVKRSGEVRR
ncbi:hypothetical protein Hbl1158_10195 [Halobaculum sp. CBA1158]|uniref:hypothetical protein n=1 Tax=Halobaculum sp. CBA1158 TaxID=2904243 RepID=UPI001F3A2E02|nr:hypothetical protein [Halobaculum sp. CBA1158]UIO98904.1 hypothetical protein Hbl1158_10195 [Halobaculum sp. CBA1158]